MSARIPRVRPEQLDPDQRALYDAIVGGPRAAGMQHFALTDDDGALNGPFNALLLAPAAGGALQSVGAALRYRSALTPRMRESAILLVATHWHSAFEWHAHEGAARAAGLTEEDLAVIRALGTPPFVDPAEVACLRVVSALLRGDVSDDEWAAASDHLDPRLVFELSTLVGYYSTLALQLRTFRAERDE